VFTTDHIGTALTAKCDNNYKYTLYNICNMKFNMIVVENIDVLLLLFYIVLRDVWVCKYNKTKLIIYVLIIIIFLSTFISHLCHLVLLIFIEFLIQISLLFDSSFNQLFYPLADLNHSLYSRYTYYLYFVVAVFFCMGCTMSVDTIFLSKYL
jgi:hypothetical protein